MRLLGTVLSADMRSPAVHFQAGDVLYGRLRPYLNKVLRPSFEGLCSAEFIVFPRSEHLDPAYLQYFLNSSQFVGFASHLNAGDRPRVDFEQIASFPIPVPPLAEQRRIVAAIEEHLSRLDAAVAGLKRVQAQLPRYRAAVLKAAVEGRLVKSDSASGGSDTRQAASGRDVLGEAGRTSLASGEGFWPLPEGWCWARVDSVGEVTLGRQRAPQYQSGRFSKPYLRVANVSEDHIDLTDVKEMDFDDQHLAKYRLLEGDILLAEGQSPELVGESAIYRGGVEELCFQKTLHRFRADRSVVSPEYCQMVFKSYLHTGVFRRVASLTVNIAHLTLERLKPLPFPVPPIQERQRIVAEVDRRLSIADALGRASDIAFRRADGLRRAILARAFSGQLVPQDPNDEPASVLLERIRRARAAAPIKPGRPRRAGARW